MKKTYIKPELNIQILQSTGMLALSLGEGLADNTKPTYIRGQNDWDIWGTDDNFDEDYDDDY